MVTVIHTINELRSVVRDWKNNGLSVGLVPTMGALHEGHASLIEKSVKMCDKTIVSVFVNPTQFGINEDFSKYPRTLDKDVELVQKFQGDVVFAPSAEEMYGENYNKDLMTLVCPPYDLVNQLCGKSRPGHFDGVASVVSKLFNISHCDYAFFGQKDAQQLFIIKKMVEDLNFDINIIPCPIVREDSGLAISSRNQYLSEDEKKEAITLSKALFTIKQYIDKGIVDVESLFDVGLSVLSKQAELEYLNFIDYDNFEKIDTIKNNTLIAICARVGSTRLIDNIVVEL